MSWPHPSKHPVPSRDKICGHRKARKAGLEVRTSEHRGGRGVRGVPATPADLLGPGSTQTPQYLPTAPQRCFPEYAPRHPTQRALPRGLALCPLATPALATRRPFGPLAPRAPHSPGVGPARRRPGDRGTSHGRGGGRNGHRSPSRFTKLRNSGTYRGPSPLTGKGWPEVRRGPPTASRGETQGTARVPAGQGQERRVT